MKPATIQGSEIRVGHTINVSNRWHRISRVTPYTGPLDCLKGGVLVYWPSTNGYFSESGMTVTPTDRIEVLLDEPAAEYPRLAVVR